MIPLLGRVVPYVIAVIGVFDTMYLWTMHHILSVLLGIVTIHFIHLIFKHYPSSSPKHAHHLFICAVAEMIVIIGFTYSIFF